MFDPLTAYIPLARVQPLTGIPYWRAYKWFSTGFLPGKVRGSTLYVSFHHLEVLQIDLELENLLKAGVVKLKDRKPSRRVQKRGPHGRTYGPLDEIGEEWTVAKARRHKQFCYNNGWHTWDEYQERSRKKEVCHAS